MRSENKSETGKRELRLDRALYFGLTCPILKHVPWTVNFSLSDYNKPIQTDATIRASVYKDW